MPRISGPEFRPDWVDTGSAGRDAGIGCKRVDGAFGDAEGPVIDGGICVSAMPQRRCPWGDVCFGATESEQRLFEAAGFGSRPLWLVAFGD
ncbi:hypothetical protein L6172_02940 [Thalassospiraceae bacterium SW-3-3]|nr:hypothetical protein L6172_02940 [Thalassospiraceae bacterium SW-3-3]